MLKFSLDLSVVIVILLVSTKCLSQPRPPRNCSDGKVYLTCGTACPPTCDNPIPQSCTLECVMGCFCPEGLVEHAGGCVPPEDCPTRECTNGKVDSSCGSACPLTCNNYQNPPACIEICVGGCFCPEGQVEHGRGCVPPSNCPGPDDDPCDGYPHCREDQTCQVAISGCGPEDSYCNRYPECKNPPYVPCGSDAFLACDSEWTYCLQQNKTRRASCVSDCFSRNGNCDEDDVCVTTVSGGEEPTIQCVGTSDLRSDCPAGQVMSDCPSLCEETCDDVVRGTGTFCATVCAPPGCVCPRGLVHFRDRCVDPRLCYVLLTYPPAIRPLPIVDSNTVLLSLYSSDLDSDGFRTRPGQSRFISNIHTTLASNGYDEVQVSIHGVHYDDGQLQIVIQLSGRSISRASVDTLLRILNQNSDDLEISIQGLSQVDVEYVDDGMDMSTSNDMDLSNDAIIGIAVSSVVAGIAIVVAWIAVVTCCCVIKSKNKISRSAPSYPQGEKSNTYTNVVFHEEDDLTSLDPKKDKVVLESFCD